MKGWGGKMLSVLFFLSFVVGVFFLFLTVILVIVTPKGKKQKAPESQEGEDVCF